MWLWFAILVSLVIDVGVARKRLLLCFFLFDWINVCAYDVVCRRNARQVSNMGGMEIRPRLFLRRR